MSYTATGISCIQLVINEYMSGLLINKYSQTIIVICSIRLHGAMSRKLIAPGYLLIKFIYYSSMALPALVKCPSVLAGDL